MYARCISNQQRRTKTLKQSDKVKFSKRSKIPALRDDEHDYSLHMESLLCDNHIHVLVIEIGCECSQFQGEVLQLQLAARKRELRK